MDEDLMIGLGMEHEELDLNETEIKTDEETIGNIKVSVDVVAKIAAIAATEIDGVASMYTNFVSKVAQRLGSDKAISQGVKVDITEDMAIVDLYLIVDYGVKIPELAWNVQEKVKESVESMTGLNVTAVNIHIEGINFEKDTEETITIE